MPRAARVGDCGRNVAEVGCRQLAGQAERPPRHWNGKSTNLSVGRGEVSDGQRGESNPGEIKPVGMPLRVRVLNQFGKLTFAVCFGAAEETEIERRD